MNRWTTGIATCSLALLALGSCGADDDPARANPSPVGSSLRSAYVAARQSAAAGDARFAFRPGPEAELVAWVARQGLRAGASVAGTALSASGQSWEATLRGARLRCGATALELDEAVAPRPGAHANRVEYARLGGAAPVSEWIASGPLGIEQGFEIGAAPCDDSASLDIDVAVGGLVPVETEPGVAAELRDASGVPRLRYTDLSAADALGRALPAALVVRQGVLSLHVDARGARYPVTVDPLAWVQVAELVAKDGHSTDLFGAAIALDGDTALVGAYQANQNWGTAYFFARTSGVWSLQQEVMAPVPYAGFGQAVALSGTTAIISANSIVVGGHANQGAAYVYEQSGGVWTKTQMLSASDGAANDGFGFTVTLSGDTAFFGVPTKMAGTNKGPGAVYVFGKTGSTWAQEQELAPSDGVAGDWFGQSIAASGTTAIIGAGFRSVGANLGQGAAYVFTQSASGTWTQQQELTGSSGQQGDGFGWAIAMSGNTAIIGASAGFTGNPGSAYVFQQSGGSWSEQVHLNASDPNALGVGSAVSLSGTTAFVGSPNTQVGANIDQGAVYVFTQSGSTWAQTDTITSDDGGPIDLFGGTLAVSGTDLLVGASERTIGANAKQGAAYVESYGLTDASPCAKVSDCATGFCVEGVCCDTTCDTPCHACKASLKQSGGDGTCGPVKTGTSCGSSCTGNQRTASTCDATGTCRVGAKTSCPGGFACDGSACATSCASATQCASGYDCMGSTCFPKSDATCAADGHTLDHGGTSMDCAPYTCVGGACQTMCTTAADCVAPAVCGSSHQCASPPGGSGSSGGCSAGPTPEERDAPTFVLWGPVLLALAAARRRHLRA